MTGEDFNSQRRTDDSVSNQADDRSGISRRSCIKGAAVAGIAATALTTSAGAQSSVRHADEFSTVVNVVEDLGVANDGSQSIVPALYDAKSAHGNDTLFYFPEGEYYVDRQFTWDGFRNIGFVGERSESASTGSSDDSSVGAGSSGGNPGSSAAEDDAGSDGNDQDDSGSDGSDQSDSGSSGSNEDSGSSGGTDDSGSSGGGGEESSDDGGSQEESEAPACVATVEENADVQDTQTGAWTSDSGNLATFVPATYSDFRTSGHQHRMFRLGKPEDWGTPGRRLVFDGFDVDFTASNTGLRVVEADAYDGLEVRNINVEGHHDTGAYGPARFAINSSDGEGVVESFHAPDGGAFTENADTSSDNFRGPIGFLSNQYNVGSLTYRDCVLQGFSSSGLYANGPGAVHVDGGTYKNNNVAQIRLGGAGSVRNATLGTDEALSSSQHPVRQRALRFESSTSGVTVENVDIEITGGSVSEAILIKQGVNDLTISGLNMTMNTDERLRGIWIRGGPSGPNNVTIEDATIDHSVGGGYGIFVDSAGSSPGPLTIQNVTITGSPGIGGGRAAVYNQRNGAVFRNITVDQNGHSKRNGFVNEGSNVTASNVDR